MGNRLFLALDGGGTKTVALLCDEAGHVLGFGLSGPGNALSAGDEQAVNHAVEAVRKALGTHKINEVFHCRLYIPGFSRCLPLFLKKFPGLDAGVCSDSMSAYYSCIGKPGGIVVLSGTGSFALGLDASNRQYTAGGWGHLLGDEGSGYHIGKMALQALLHNQEEGIPPTGLDGEIMQAFHVSQPRDVIKAVYSPGFGRPQIASLCPLVGRAANRGEKDALQILDRAAEELCLLAQAVQKRMALLNGPVGLAGGVIRLGKLISVPFESILKKSCPGLTYVKQRYSPVVGGMLYLMAEYGYGDWELGEAMEKELKEKYGYADGPIL
jgi:N-acetylglucosamine kinase-like BadF-type ATPase